MAMSGKDRCVKTGILDYGSSGKELKLYVRYYSEQSAATNSSKIHCGMYIIVPDGWNIGEWTDFNGSYVGTTKNTFSGGVPKNTKGTYWLTDEEEIFTVKHKGDGTGTATIQWQWGVKSPWAQMVTPSSSFTIPLPTIGRTSSVSATNAYIGNTSTISISRQNDAFTHKLQYQVDGETKWVNINNGNKVGTSYNWTIPSGIYGKLSPNSKTVEVKIKCTTYNGSTSVGSDTCTITVTGKNAELKPKTPTLTASVVDGYSDYYIKGKSKVKLTSNKPTTKYGATICEYIFTGPNTGGTSVTINTKTSGIIQSYGNLTYGVQVKDSRGVLSDKGTVTINVKNYAAPTIKSINVTKTENKSNMTITAKVVTTHYAIGSNALTISMSEIESKNGNISPSLSGPTTSGSTIITSAYTYTYSRVPLDTSGDITATVYDTISGRGKPVSKLTSITPATRMLNFASNGKTLAVGGFATPNSSTNRFECHWDAHLNKDIYFDQTNEQRFTFGNASKSNWKVNLYKGSTSSTTVMGVYDVTNDRLVWKYMNDKNFYFGSSIGITSNYDTKFAIFCKMQDKNDHDILVRKNDGLTVAVGSYIGSEYSSSTRLDLRGGIVRIVNASGETTISDERLKTDWEDLNKYSEFYDNIEPKSFKYINGSSGRNHIGFSAQQIEQSLVSSGLSTSDFAGLVKYKVDPSSEEYNGYDEEYGLIYSEFIALNTYMIQKLKSENEELKNKVSLLEEKLSSIITEIENLKESIKNEA